FGLVGGFWSTWTVSRSTWTPATRRSRRTHCPASAGSSSKEDTIDTEITTSGLIVVQQLPVIVERLHSIKAATEAKVQDALSLACTEETVQVVKKRRAELNSEFNDLEAQRKAAKN